MSALRLIALLALFPLAAFAQKTEDEAGDTSEADKDSAGPLRERVRPVSGHVFLMSGRFEMSPGLGMSIKDAFFLKLAPELALTYHFTEAVAVSLRGAYNLSLVSDASQICTQAGDPTKPAGCVKPTQAELSNANAFGQMSAMAGLELQWSPIYGKIGLVAEKFLSFNMYGALGASLVMYGRKNTATIGVPLGVGFRFFINKFLCVRLELRDIIYNEHFAAQTTPVQTDELSSLRNQLMGELGLSIFLPTSFDGAGR